MATKILAILALLLTPTAWAATFNISAGASTSTVQSTINSAAGTSGTNTVQFAAGSYSLSQITVPCPVGTLIIQGPPTTYPQTRSARPTAHITSTTGGAPQFAVAFGCSNWSIYYLDINGNQPASGGGSIYVNGANSNFNIAYNYVHGNQELYPPNTLTGNAGGKFFNYNDTNANLIRLDGSAGDGRAQTNFNIHDNIEGDGSTDCSNVMQWIGQTVSQGCTNNSGQVVDCFIGYDQDAGYCNGLMVNESTTNGHVYQNLIQHQEQAMKWAEGCQSGSSCFFIQKNDILEKNDLSQIHRIIVETQQSPNDPSNPFQFNNNDFHDPTALPGFGSWGLSAAQNSYTNMKNNLMEYNGSGASTGSPGSAEFWGAGTYSNNLVQGSQGCGMQYWSGGLSILNNRFEGNFGTSGNAICQETASGTPPTISGNTFSTTVSTYQSNAPTLSPSGGSFSGSQVVTVHNPGFTSGVLPLGNTGTWITTDGSTPAPGAGTSVYYNDGDTFTITAGGTTVVHGVGMWGAITQPTSYPSGFGFTPSSVVTATFTNGGGTPSAASPTYSPTSGTFVTSQVVTLSDATAGSSIFYCNTPGCTATPSSTLYTGPLTVTTTTTINAVATASGFTTSPISSATYTQVAPGTVATPVFNPAAPLTYTGTQNVSISTSTSGATLYYTLDGTTPTTSSTVYAGLIPLSSTTTLKAIGAESGFTNSAVTTGVYTASLFLGNNQIDNTTSNTYPGAANGIYAVTGAASGGYTVTGCVVNQGTAAVTNGAHTQCFVNLATSSTTQAANSICSGSYTNTSTTGTIANITMSGCPTLSANQGYWISSVTDDTLQPSGLGFNDCGSTCTGTAPTVGIGTYASFYFTATYGQTTAFPTTPSKGVYQVTQYLMLTPATTTVATPVISPGSMTITGTQAVTITDSTSGSSIFYTTDGTTPTSGSTPYTGSFNVSTTTTVKAIATKAGSLNSAVASNTYTLSTGTITSVYFTSASGVNFVIPGSQDQLTVNIRYSDGTTTQLPRQGAQDARGTQLNFLASSNPAVATISTTETVVGVSNTVQPNWTLLTATITDSSGNPYTANWIEGCGKSLLSGIQGGGIAGGTP